MYSHMSNMISVSKTSILSVSSAIWSKCKNSLRIKITSHRKNNLGNDAHCKKRQCAHKKKTSEDFGIWLEIACSWNKWKTLLGDNFSESEETIKNRKWQKKNKDFKDILETFFSFSTLSFQPHTKRTNHFSKRNLRKQNFPSQIAGTLKNWQFQWIFCASLAAKRWAKREETSLKTKANFCSDRGT